MKLRELNYSKQEFYRLPVETRIKFAQQGKYIDYIVDDPEEDVRYELFDAGYAWDKLADDICDGIRECIAIQGLYPEKFARDYSATVRRNVAFNGQCLDILVDDVDEYVRHTVALHLYGLEKLIYDKSPMVRDDARKLLKICNKLHINRKAPTEAEKSAALSQLHFYGRIKDAEQRSKASKINKSTGKEKTVKDNER